MTVQSVDRALDLLDLVRHRPGGLVELSERASLPLTTTSRLLGTLTERRAVARTADGVYHVGPFIQALVASVSVPAATIESCGAEVVADLADELDEAACLSLPLGAETLTVMQVAALKPVRAEDWTGHRWPITGGGSGAVMLSTWPDGRVEPVLARLTAAQRRAVRSDIEAARHSGVSWAHGSHVEGLSSVAAPVLGVDGEAVAAILAYGPSFRFPVRGRQSAAERSVARAGHAISERLQQHG